MAKTTYTEELAKEICEIVAISSKGLPTLCRENKHWPRFQTIYDWRNKYKEFDDMYARAKQRQVEALVEEILEIINDNSKDFYINDDGKKVPSLLHVNKSRLQVDTLKWLAAKLAPRLYGDKTIISGADGKELLVQLTNENG